MKKIFSNKLIKKNFNPNQFLKLKKFLSSQGIIIKKKQTFKFGFEKFKTLYLTGLSSLLIILIAFIIPIFSEINPKVAKNLKFNESNKKFKIVLEGDDLENKSKVDDVTWDNRLKAIIGARHFIYRKFVFRIIY